MKSLNRTFHCVVLGFLIGVLVALIHWKVPFDVSPQKPHVPKKLEEPLGTPKNLFKGRQKPPPPNPKSNQQKSPTRLYWANAKNLSTKEVHCLALNIYHEARGERHPGKVGVAQVTLNRVDTAFRKKTTVCAVVYDSAQFSWTLDSSKKYHQPKGDAWEDSLQIAQDVANGLRVHGLEESLYYHATWINPPYWAKHLLFKKSIGQHRYYSPPV